MQHQDTKMTDEKLSHETNKVVYLTLDYITGLQGETHSKRIRDHLKLSFSAKLKILKEKIIAGYEALKQLHPDAHILITMREGAIEVGEAKVPWIAANIMPEKQKDDLLKELKGLTAGRDLILVPGTIAHAIESKESTAVYNRAYVLMKNEIVGYQDKVEFHSSDLLPKLCKFKNPKAPKQGQKNELNETIEFNKIIKLDINSKLKINILIDICRDHHFNNNKDAVDLHLVLSNATFIVPEKMRGKISIHCDGNRPTTFITKEENQFVYASQFLLPDHNLYKVSIKESQDYLAREQTAYNLAVAAAIDANPYYPPEMIALQIGREAIAYTPEDIYKPGNQVNLTSSTKTQESLVISENKSAATAEPKPAAPTAVSPEQAANLQRFTMLAKNLPSLTSGHPKPHDDKKKMGPGSS